MDNEINGDNHCTHWNAVNRGLHPNASPSHSHGTSFNNKWNRQHKVERQ
jgi:hypothetical protein